MFFPVLWPSCAKLVSLYVSVERTGVASGIYDAGSLVGLSASFVVAGVISDWRTGLAFTSITGILYSILYYILTKYTIVSYSSAKLDALEYKYNERSYSRELKLSISNVILPSIGFFLTLQTWGLLISWISLFFVNEMKLEYSSLITYMVLLAFAGTIAEVFAGLLSDRIGGFTGRKIVISIGQSIAVAGLFTAYTYYGSREALYSIIVVFVAYRFASMTFWAILNDTIPRYAVGKIGGLYSAIAGISLTVAPIINGYLIEVTHSLRIGFLYTALTLLLSTLAYLFLKQHYRRGAGE